MLSLQQRLMRQTGITATDIVTIAGENPWRSTASVYESKLASRAQIEKEAAEEQAEKEQKAGEEQGAQEEEAA